MVVVKNKSKDSDSEDVPGSMRKQHLNIDHENQPVVDWKVGDLVLESPAAPDSSGIGIIVKVWPKPAQYGSGGPYMIYFGKEVESFWVLPCFMEPLS